MADLSVVFTYEIQLTKDGEVWFRNPDEPPGIVYVPEPMAGGEIAESVFFAQVDNEDYDDRTEIVGIRVVVWYKASVGADGKEFHLPRIADKMFGEFRMMRKSKEDE